MGFGCGVTVFQQIDIEVANDNNGCGLRMYGVTQVRLPLFFAVVRVQETDVWFAAR